MKLAGRRLQLILIGLLMLCGPLSAQITFSADDLNSIAKGEAGMHSRKPVQSPSEKTSDYDVSWYRCVWMIEPNVRLISGNVTVLFKPLKSGFDTLVLDMNQALVVTMVTYRNIPVFTWKHASDKLTIPFTSALPLNVADSVSVYYTGVPPVDGFGTFGQATHNGAPIIWTLSEPYGASDWWPCKNDLTDKADSVDIYIGTPTAYKSASNGLLVSTTSSAIGKLDHWKHRYPIATYLICLAVTNYASYTQKVPYGNDTLNVLNLVYPEDSATAVTQTPLIVPMIQVFDTLFGIYPFQREKYGHAQFGWGGGMEHQTMTFVKNFQFELIAHELAHMWFGDKVTCGSWTDIWLNEGFATYLSGLCYEHLAPDLFVRFRQVRVKSITSQPGGSVYCPDTTDINRIFDSRLSYAKGALILHQLRWIMGDSVFFAALNNYLNDYSHAYGFARTENLRSHLESSYGHDLGWYFNEWYTGEGYPQYMVNWTQTGDTVAFTLKQTQSSPTVSFFELPVQIKFKNATHDTMIRVNNTFSGQLFSVKIPFKVDSLIFDPEFQIISGNNTVNAVAEHALEATISVVPNPATDHITFYLGGLIAGSSGSIRIYDDCGRKRDEVFPAAGLQEVTLDTRDFSAGIYFYSFSGKDFRANGKFLIRR